MSPRVNRLLAAAVGLAAVLACVLLTAYFVAPISRADATALTGLRSLSESHAGVSYVGHRLAHSVDLPYLLVGMAAIGVAGLVWGRRRQAFAALTLVAVANVLAQALKIAAAHPRYQPVLGSHQLSHDAFPSGHTTAAMSLALAAILVVPTRWRPLTAILAGSYALAVSIALVIVGWHSPSDVLGGFLVVGLVSALVIAGLAALEGEPAQRRSVARRTRWRLRTAAVLALQLGLLGLAVVGGALLATHPGALASYVEAHTTAVAAALAIAIASLGLVSGVTAELEAA